MKKLNFPDTVILADGSFPRHEIPLDSLRNAARIICCDGAAEELIQNGLEPFAIVGDCDSLSRETADKYAHRLYIDDDQETNDLTKAIGWCTKSGYTDIIILGATGKREDHTAGNISLLAEYIRKVKVIMITDTGIFYPFISACSIPSYAGQQVSVFSLDPEAELSSSGLKYPLLKRKLLNWWEGTLNEATGDHFELEFTGGAVIVFMAF